MPASTATLKNFAARARDRALALRHSARARRIIIAAAVVLAVYALIGFLAVPALLHRWIDANASKLLGRPVTVGALQFNPFTLKLGADNVHVGEADGKTAFIDADRIVLSLSWMSLLRWAPVFDEVEVQHPRIALTRAADMHFNFSDLIERFSAPAPSAAPTEPARFSLSNIRVREGEVRFDDRATNATHRLDDIEIGIPFLANLPRDVDVFVQPLLAMRVDGRPLRIEGQTKPFKNSLESTIDLTLDRLDLPKYLVYFQAELPVAVPRGILSGSVRVHFVQDKTPQLRFDGVAVLDDFAMTEKSGAPMAEAGRVIASFADVQPLISRYRFGNVNLDHVSVHYLARAGARSNYDVLFGPPKPAASKKPPSDVGIANLGIVAGRFDYVDQTLDAGPATITIDTIAGTVTDLDTLKGAAAVDATARHNGGNLATRGKLDLPANRYTGALSAKDVGLPPLQPFVVPAGNPTVLQQGRFDSDGNFFADWKGAFNLHIEPATAHVRDLAIGTAEDKEPQIAWKALDIALTKFDLAAAEARHGEVTLHGLSVKAQRGRDGKIDLAALAGGAPAKTVAAKTGKPVPVWKWSIARLALDAASVRLRDLSTAKPTEVAVESINGDVAGLNDDLKQPLKLALSGSIEKGSFDVNGSVRPEPLDLDLKIKTRELSVAGFQPYVDVPLNVRVVQAFLTSDGELRYAEGKQAKTAYRGRVALGRVRVKDKVTSDDFLSLRVLDVGALDYAQSGGPVQVKLGDVALSDFYARIIMNANGRLNLADVTGGSAAQPISVTRADEMAKFAPAPPPAEAKPQTPPLAATASIQVGRITLSRGHLNYTDNFIKPNYTANITQLSGKIGPFGTAAGGAPAVVDLQGLLDDNAQVGIEGSMNPLTPSAFVDIKGKASGVELTHLSAYSTKYTGYPIIKGRLNADVHYVLDQGKLNADNHFNIDQLTFGEVNEDPGVSHLPVKLAVALLKDSNGVIDVNVPVSGSLDDPQFSLGSMVWRAIGGMIAKAATAPFRLLASVFKGGGGGNEELGYVEYAPGDDRLDEAAKTKLVQVAKILNERPSLNLGIIGRTDPNADRDGLRKVMVDNMIRREYIADHGGSEETAPATLSPEDTERYLEAAYKHADFPKERNLIGLTKSQPPEEMRRLLETNLTVDESSMLHLAERRAGHVVGFLHGKVDDRRLWTLAPKLDSKGIDDQGKTTRVDFTLQ